MTKCRIMGGMFGLEPGTGEAPSSLLRNGDLLLVNARSAFLLLAEQLKPGRVWLPSYLCGVVPHVLAARAVPFAYYPVDRLLGQTSADWLCQVRPGDVVVLVDYFGLPCDPAWA